MADQRFPLHVAPDMGSFEDGVARFRTPKPPYARGGGTPASRYLEEAVLRYLGKAEPGESHSVSLTATGQAANHTVFKALHGGDMVVSSHLFGTTKVDLRRTFKRAGNDVDFVDPTNTQAFIDRTTHRTNSWFVEAISNPAGRVPDFHSLSEAARERGIVLVIDSTLSAGMPAFSALDYADIVTVSLTKQAGGGENNNIGGAIIVNSADYNWAGRELMLPELREYFEDARGALNLPDNPFGTLVSKISTHEGSGAIAPEVAVAIADSLPGLERRLKTQCDNARVLAEVLQDHPAVNTVQLAGVNSDPENDERTQDYLGSNHFVLLVDLKGGFNAARDFINTQEFMHAVVLGQKVTGVSHPASSTHRQYTPEEQAKLGIHEGTVRISVGTEPEEDLRKGALAALEV